MPVFNTATLKVGAAAVAAAFVGSQSVFGGGGSSFSAQSIVMENDNYISRAALVGAVASRQGSASFWFMPTADNTTFRTIKSDSGNRVKYELDSSKRMRVTVTDGTTSFIFRTVSQVLPTDGECHYAVAYDTNAAAGLKTGIILRNGVSDVEIFSDTGVAFLPPVNVTNYIGAVAAGASPCAMTLREFAQWLGTYIDWTAPANLAKVYSAGSPVNLGNSGELVTGTAPAIYLSLRGNDAAASFLVNRGTGGDFAQASGTPTIRADLPVIGYGDSLTFGTGATVFPTNTWIRNVTRGLNTARRRINLGVGGESATAIRLRFVAEIAGYVAKYPKAIYTLEGGYNSIANGAASILNDMTIMKNALLAADPAASYIFIGIPNGNLIAGDEITGSRGLVIADANAQLATLFGTHFIDIRQWLIDNGLAAAGLGAADADDLADIAAGIVPRRLRMADTSVHWSDAGQVAVGIAVRAKMQSLGYD